jgi:hypothetical protein
MAIDNTDSFSGPFLPNGATLAFPFSFVALTAAEVVVMLRAADGAETYPVGYSVTINPDGGGSVNFAEAPAAGPELFVMLDPAFTQPISFENGSAWLAEPVNEVADRAAQRDIWLRGRVLRTLSLPFGEEGMVLPGASARANKYISFLPDGGILLSHGTGADSGLREDIAETTGSEMIGFEQASGDASARTAQAKLRERLSINDFEGADPTGVADSTAAIVAAIARGAATGQPVNVDGVYRYTAQIEVPTHVRIVGFGHTSDPGTRGKSCFLKDFNSGTEAAFILAGYDAMVTDVHFDSVNGRTGDLVQMASERQVIENCSFTHAGRDGLRIGNDAMVANANLWRVVGVYCLANGRHGIFIDDPTEPPDANAGCMISADCRGNLGDGIHHDTGLWNTFINPVCQGNKGVGFRLTANSRACNILGGDIEGNTDPVTNPDNIQGLIENGALGNKIDAPLFGTGKWTNEAPQGTNKVSYYDSNFSLIVDGDIVSVANPRAGGAALINLYADEGLDLFGQFRAKKITGSGGGVEIWTKPNGNVPAKAIEFTDKQNCVFAAGLVEKSAAIEYGPGPYIEPLKCSWATMTVTDAAAYSPYIEPAGAVAGQSIRITIKNTTGGAIAAGSYTPAKLSGPIQPGAGKAISVELRFDGASYIEVARSAEVTL